MSYTIKIETKITITNPALGGTDEAPTLTYTEATSDLKKEVPFKLTSAAKTIWDPANDNEASLTTFKTLILYTDVEVEIEFTTKEGDATEELATFNLVPGLVYALGSNKSRYNHSASDAFAGTLDVINKIRVKESNGTEAIGALILLE